VFEAKALKAGREKVKTLRIYAAIVCAFTVMLALGGGTAQAQRALIKRPDSPRSPSEVFLLKGETENVPGGQVEGACGVATRGNKVYVSDYYHHAIETFYGGSERILGNPLDGYCGLAFAPGGALYASEWHEAVYAVLPSKQLIDPGESTGVAVDQGNGDVYVNDGTYVARYEPPIALEELPVEKIGLGNLEEGFGVAVEAGRVYVPDAATDVVKVYEPDTDPTNPVLTITGPSGGFSSLRDAAIATDHTNGHVLVLDNLQPGFEFPEGVVDEFASDGKFLGQASKRVIDGEPSGLTVVADEPPDSEINKGDLFVTTGNSEEANVFHFGPYVASPAPPLAPLASSGAAGSEEGAEPANVEESASLLVSSPSPRLVSDATGKGAQLIATVDSPGTLSTTGRGLVPLKASLTPGRHSLYLHLNAAGRRTLGRSKTHRLRVRVGVHYRAENGGTADDHVIVGFKEERR
jgi:hypothetical protein